MAEGGQQVPDDGGIDFIVSCIVTATMSHHRLSRSWKEIPWEDDTFFINPQRRKYCFIHFVYYACMCMRGGVEDSNLPWTGTLSTLL